MKQFEYLRCNGWDEAAGHLADLNRRSKLLAGGTDLLVQIKNGELDPELVLDISRIPGSNYIEEKDGYLELGAMVTHGQAAASSLVRSRAPLLAQACLSMGSPQVRNMGTLVGNIVNAQPAADAAVALIALQAEIKVWEKGGETWQPVVNTYLGPGLSSLESKLVTGLRFRSLKPGQGSSYQRLARRQSLALPMLNAAIILEVKGDIISAAHIVVAPVAPVPLIAKDVEVYLTGKPFQESVFREAGAMISEIARPRDSRFRGSALYRRTTIGRMVEAGLAEAAEEATKGGRDGK